MGLQNNFPGASHQNTIKLFQNMAKHPRWSWDWGYKIVLCGAHVLKQTTLGGMGRVDLSFQPSYLLPKLNLTASVKLSNEQCSLSAWFPTWITDQRNVLSTVVCLSVSSTTHAATYSTSACLVDPYNTGKEMQRDQVAGSHHYKHQREHQD